MDAREQVLHALMHDVHMTLMSKFIRKRQHLSIEQSVDAREQVLHALKCYMLSCMILRVFKLDARVHYSLSIQ